MAQIFAADLETMDYSLSGEPFCFITGKSSLDSSMNGMDYSLGGGVFWGNAWETSSGPANMKTWANLASASVKTINDLAIASVKTWDGLN